MAKNTNEKSSPTEKRHGCSVSGSYKSSKTDKTAAKATLSKSDRLTLRASKLAYENRDKRLG